MQYERSPNISYWRYRSFLPNTNRKYSKIKKHAGVKNEEEDAMNDGLSSKKHRTQKNIQQDKTNNVLIKRQEQRGGDKRRKEWKEEIEPVTRIG